jgi:hypothetical protein
MKLLFALFPVVALALPSSNLLAARQTPRIEILGSSYQGSGCPAGTVFNSLASTSALWSYEAFDQVAVGPNTSVRSQDCQVTFRVRYPIGCTSATFQVSHYGFGDFDQGVTGSASAQYSLSAGSANPTSPSPLAISYASLDGIGNAVWSTTHNVATTANIAAGQQDVTFISHLTVSINTPSNPALGGILPADSLAIAINNQAAC